MYKIKKEEIDKIKKYGTVREISKETGLTEGYISQILNGTKTKITKQTAYAITKAISSDFEIEDLFYYRTN